MGIACGFSDLLCSTERINDASLAESGQEIPCFHRMGESAGLHRRQNPLVLIPAWLDFTRSNRIQILFAECPEPMGVALTVSIVLTEQVWSINMVSYFV